MWGTIIADIEALLTKIKTFAASEASAFWSALKTVISTDAQQFANDFWPDLVQIGVNLQNAQGGISLATFIPAFIAAAVPVAEKEALTLLETDWQIISNAVAGHLNIPSTTGNAGVVS